MTAALGDPLEVGDLTLPNRLYRAPLLECAGDDAEAGERLADELEPAAASGAGLVFQGATLVRGEGGAVAPNMTRIDTDEKAERLRPVTEAVHDHGGRIVIQLDHGGLRSLETWHREYRDAATRQQLAVSRVPIHLRAAARTGFLEYDAHVLTTAEVYELAADFGRAARRAVEAGYDGVHLSSANMGIVQQFCSPYYNRRDDEFADGGRFLELLHDEIRERAGDVPLFTKVPTEKHRPPFVRTGLSTTDALGLAVRLAEYGYDALVPVHGSTFWDMSLVRGEYPERGWAASQFRSGYEAAFGSRLRARLVAAATRVEAARNPPAREWNADLCRRVRQRVDVPVLCEGGIRERGRIDRLLGEGDAPAACDAVGLGRPFYAEPRLPARLLADTDGAVLCADCNNCIVPQATGAPGMCRTPDVLRERGRLERAGVYDRTPDTQERS
ncbi:oxidoreductase [Halomarina oriensis]|uniref:NADH:flavin oxidoreductase n=1 Tax=Halomarina oriensis TaxID=671145 RepID=A0A6B0GP98_9EURY|nr:NADH:flavin oxidoreductase [Halomarina oriensis]MWG35801.1 NADH:flavin oxidoreductase [Halomarina oriensis]